MNKTMINRDTQLLLDGRGLVTVRQNDHIATGGEGSVFRAGSSVIKLYSDKAKMVRDGMDQKISLLSKIKHPYIVAPKGVVYKGSRKEPVGYYMPYVKGEGLSQVFTNSYWSRNGFKKKDAVLLTEKIYEAVEHAHKSGAVMVDANELNWLVQASKKNGLEPRVIDVDSWSIGKWGAQVIMPSIRDYSASQFDVTTDWFSWGILSFQVLTGIHPYKGSLSGYKRAELERRMKDNASVFAPGVKLNRAVRDFKTHIPGRLLDWYVDTFQHGGRTVPPRPSEKGVSVTGNNLVVQVREVAHQGVLIIEKLFSSKSGSIKRIYPCGVVHLDTGELVNMKDGKTLFSSKSAGELVRVQDGWVFARVKKGELLLSHVTERSYKETSPTLNLACQNIVQAADRLFVVTEQGLTEINFNSFGGSVVASVGNTWGVMVNSTRWFDGVGLQDSFGATYVIAPFDEKACAQVRVRELDGLRVISAHAGHRFVTAAAITKKGEYKRVEIAFNRNYSGYSVRTVDLQSPELNTVMLPKGVSASIHDDGELTIFVPTNGSQKVVKDKFCTLDKALSRIDNTVVTIDPDGKTVRSVRMS